MVQSATEKKEALRTVLPLLNEHLHIMERIRSALGCLPSQGEVPPTVIPSDDMDELWVRHEEFLAKRYRTREVGRALAKMGEDPKLYHGRLMAQALYAEYVEPWPEFRAGKRHRAHIEKGLERLAAKIKGELIPYAPMQVSQERPRDAKRRQIGEMLEAGFTYDHIQREIEGASRELISKIKKNLAKQSA